ncbi:MAG: hypothetical protein WA397_09640 [Roseiarcus sp.]
MSQRVSGFARRPNEDYSSPPWLAAVIVDYLKGEGVSDVWEPAVGAGLLAAALEAEGIRVFVTAGNFLAYTTMPDGVDCICTNPPYGAQGRLAADFIRHAFRLKAERIVMLLRVDFDSGKTRTDLFRDRLIYAGKIVLLDRIKWFEGPSSPSDNHALFVWDRGHRGEPWIRYAAREPATTMRQAFAAGLSSS